MSVPNPLLTEGGFELETESGQILLTESDQTFANAEPYAALITSEHNQKPRFMNLVQTLCAGLGDVTALLESIPAAFDLNGGAMGAQLDILGLWIGQSRIIPSILVPGFFGFSEVSTGLPDGLQLTFGELSNSSVGGIWYDFGAPYNGTTTLNDMQYQSILNTRIIRNQSPGTLAALEVALQDIFGGPCSVIDTSNFKLAIYVGSPVTAVDQALIGQMDILPRPAGVLISSITYGAPSMVTAAPTFNPAPGTYTNEVTVTVKSATPQATLYITQDGSTPTGNSPSYPSGVAFAVSNTLTLNAIAIAPNFSASPVSSATYTITPLYGLVATPVFSPVSGTYSGGFLRFSATCATPGAVIHWRSDGSTPTALSPILGPNNQWGLGTVTVKAIAVATGYSQSLVGSATYTITP